MQTDINLFYFSGTGNTRLVAAAAAEVFEAESISCRLLELSRGTLSERPAPGAMFGIAFPVYGLGLPRIVREFLNRLEPVRNGRCFIIANAHSNAGLSIRQVEKLLSRMGYSLAGALSTLTPSSSIITEDTEDDDRAEEMRLKAVAKAKVFADDLIYNKAGKERSGANLRERLVSLLFRLAMPGPVVKSAHYTENCTGCGSCAEGCPAGNIKMKDGRPSWDKNCEVCMRCINLCPNNAIEMMGSVGRIRYKGGLI